MDDHPIQLQASSLQQRHHQVMAEGPRRGVGIETRQDVLGLGLVDPDRYLAPAGGIAEQHDGAATGRIEGNTGNLHFDHGRALPFARL